MQALSILVGIVLVAGVVTSAFLLWCAGDGEEVAR